MRKNILLKVILVLVVIKTFLFKDIETLQYNVSSLLEMVIIRYFCSHNVH